MKSKQFLFSLFALIFGLILFPAFVPIAVAQNQGIQLPQNTGLPEPNNSGAGPIVNVLTTVMNWILAVFLILALISFVVTGIQYIFSFGGSIENAKNNFWYSVIAVLIVAGALVIVNTIDNLLKGIK